MNKTLLVSSFAIASMISAFTWTASAADPDPAAAPAETSPKPAAGEHAKHKEQHPAIHAAIRSLEKAKAELQAAAHDFGGHRAAAVAECDKAIAELRAALEFDKK